MRPIVPITLAGAVLAAGASFLGPGPRETAWGALASAYLAVAAWGSIRLQSGIFGPAVIHGERTRPEVALTYDDGPDPSVTPALLDLLRARGVACTFFMIGERALEHPAIARRCREEGHLIANHTHRHSWWTNLFPGALLSRELRRAQDAIEAASGERPRYLRPPFGLANHATHPVASRLGLTVVSWDVRSFDTLPGSARSVAERVLRKVRPGAIVLLHDSGQDAARAVETTQRILDGLEARGISAVRLDRLVL